MKGRKKKQIWREIDPNSIGYHWGGMGHPSTVFYGKAPKGEKGTVSAAVFSILGAERGKKQEKRTDNYAAEIRPGTMKDRNGLS